MTRRTSAINAIVEELKRINGTLDSRVGLLRSPYQYKNNVFNNVFRRMKFLEDINDFPTILVIPETENRVHSGSGERFGTYNIRIRGYVRGDGETIELAEDLADDIEFIVESIHNLEISTTHCIIDVRTLSLTTDDGLLSPFGLCDIVVEVAYQIEDFVGPFIPPKAVFSDDFSGDFQ